jgi:hypothetical protein
MKMRVYTVTESCMTSWGQVKEQLSGISYFPQEQDVLPTELTHGANNKLTSCWVEYCVGVSCYVYYIIMGRSVDTTQYATSVKYFD